MKTRVFDMLERLAAGLALLLLLPLLLVAAACVAAESGLPVLFRQQRVGKDGSTFMVVKLRSMRAGSAGNSVTAAGDPRITAVGAFLRRYKIDELPQLWNIFTGDMKFIGLRPEVPSMVDFDDPAWRAVLSRRPGLTGISTLVYRNEEKTLEKYPDPDRAYREIVLPHKLRLSAKYLENRTPISDCKLFVLSAWYSFFPAKFDAVRILRAFVPEDAGQAEPVEALGSRKS
jgi:lipopolysaccharide/colanic/teichoic acid biosynthesis glycosyltransferase